MNRRFVASALVLASSLVATPALFAAPPSFSADTAIHATAKTKTVKFSLRNDTSAPIKVKVGDQEITLAPGHPVKVKAPVGQTVVTEEASANNPAGTVVVTVMDGLDGATLAVR
ncbi:MAG: hypothetical protein ABI142_13560 [Bryocella sp.]